MLNTKMKHFALLAMLAISRQTFAGLYDDFTQATDTNSWTPISYACLTAGTATNNSTTAANTSSTYSSIPGCNYSAPDAAGSGALRLTPALGGQHGAIVSTTPFPSNQGLQITFTAYSYGGSKNGPASDGADGISFFLLDPSQYSGISSITATNNLGAWGGSLAYSCSNTNTPHDGLTGGYLGLGMDEYGNFLNSGDNTATGIAIQTSSSSSNGYNSFTSGAYQQANRIGLRGAGNVSWNWLNATYPGFYPSSLSASSQQTAVQNTCKTGTLWNNSNSSARSISSVSNVGNILTVTIPNSNFSVGDTVTIGGTIGNVAPTQAITASSFSGTTLTLTVPNHGLSNGNMVVIAGAIFATGGTIDSATISAVSSTKSNNKYTLTVTTAAANDFAAGDTVSISGNSSSAINKAWAITSIVSPTKFTIFTNSGTNPCSCGNSGTATDTTKSTYAPTIPGTYTISGISTNTFNITLNSVPTTIVNTSGTATLSGLPTITGTYTVLSAPNDNTFTIALSSTPGTYTNVTGGTAANASQNNGPRNTSTAVADYAAIPGGYYVLPSSQLIANENTSTRNNAWPITYTLQITPNGLLNFFYSYNGGANQAVLTGWNMTSFNGPLPANFLFGFAGSTGGSTNVHEITCFDAEPMQSSSSAAANTVQAGQVRTSTQVYLASYNPATSSGSLVSDSLVNNNGTVSVSTIANWDGACVLTGGACSTMASTATPAGPVITVEAPAARQLLSWNGGGIPLQWANLSTAQQTLLNSTDANGLSRLNWLRGERSQEQTATPAGPLRVRAGVLGDIVNSSPTWVGPPSAGYAAAFADALYGSSVTIPENAGGSTSYPVFAANMATRLNVVYSGGNDGLLHGFRAGNYDSTGAYVSTLNDGYEVIGYMPYTVLANSNVVTLTNPTYGHAYFVDAPPGFGDLFYGNTWHTWLVGGLGYGGNEIYALDATNPAAFSETNAASLVMGDWTVAALTLATCVNATSNCGNNLGQTSGVPLIRRLHNGQWAIIFGNGLGSANKHAGVFIGLVNSTTGALGTFYWLDTGVGSSAAPDGIASVSSADLDGDHVTDYLYAGDLLGNVWRFDLTSLNPADWAASKFGQSSATPLFSAGSAQPITTKIAVTATITGGAQRVLLGFGTGRVTPAALLSSSNTYASGTQSVYGIWDWDMNLWNSGTTTAGSVVIPASGVKYAALSELTSPPYRTFTRANLDVNTLATSTSSTAGTRTLALNDVCWQDSSTCPTATTTTTSNTQYGWLFDLPASGEQLIYSPTFSGGALLLNTTIPPVTTVGQCKSSLPTGWSMGFNMASGGGFAQNIFSNPALGSFTVASDSSSIVGLMQSAVGTPFIVSVGSQQYSVSPTAGSSGGGINSTPPVVNKVNPQGGVTVKRITWEQLR